MFVFHVKPLKYYFLTLFLFSGRNAAWKKEEEKRVHPQLPYFTPQSFSFFDGAFFT
jgi:hypothetical protein